MDIFSVSMPANPHNISVVRRLAAEKGYSLRKVRNEDHYFDLFDKQTRHYQFRRTILGEIYDYLTSNDD